MVHDWREPATRDYTFKLAAAFFITAVGGLLVKKFGWKLATTAAPVAWATLIGGVLFLIVEAWLRGKSLRDTITWPAALIIGVAQLGAGVFPGASRSGTTILIALMLGVARPAATEFSFLLGIPTLTAAGAYQILSSFRHGEAGNVNWALVAIGTAVSAISAFVVVKWLLRFVQSHTFVGFGWYRIVLGGAILLWASRVTH
jgi:undecaprenyl-diphosphatase